MSTTTHPSTPTTTVPAPTQPRQSRGWIAATIVAAVLALAGMLAAVLMAVAGPIISHDIAGNGTTSNATSVITHHKHTTPTHHVTPVNPVHPVHPVTPSNAIKLEQTELGRLNYYEGPINGYNTQATINAITYLQRDAGLPQTGQMNTATQAALAQMLTTGNNHMAG